MLKQEILVLDDIKGWIYGPVVPEIWCRFRFMRRSDIIPINNHFYNLDDIISIEDNLLNQVWAAYGHLSGADLVDLTHKEKPWLKSRLGILLNQPSNSSVIINSETTSGFKCTESGIIPKVDKPHLLGQFQS